MSRSYVGFGFGPIQTGLMLLEAMASGNFDRYTIAEVDQALVDAVRRGGCRVVVNIARREGIDHRVLEGLWIGNPAVPEDRRVIVEAVQAADELSTAIPSVKHYDSVAALLADGLRPERPRILYASENHNFAAELLREELLRRTSESRLEGLQILNTVIGKMSGVIQDPAVIAELGLETLVPGTPRAVLVEEFNRIFVSRVRLPGYRKGIEVFEEKEDLLPFEEAKLYGHNAIHSLLGYLAAWKGYRFMSEIGGDPQLLHLGREAFLEESGAALIRKHAGLGDPLFTEAGYRAYAEDLLERIVNPWLHDEVDRICRDPARKLGYGDRLFGTMREALGQGIEPARMALGAAAALRYARRRGGLPGELAGEAPIADALAALWRQDPADRWRGRCVELVIEADTRLPR